MASTPKRLFGPAALTNAAATKYTVPAVTKTVIRHIHLSNPTASAVPVTISVGADAAGTRIFDAYSLPAGSTYDWWGYLVMDVGEVVQALAGTTGVIVATINGDERTL